MAVTAVEVVYRGIFQKTLSRNICRTIVLAARKENKIGTAFGRYGDSPERNAGTYNLTNSAPALWAYDTLTGELLGFARLPGNASGSPMTYMVDEVQYIIVPIGGSGLPAELVALKLP